MNISSLCPITNAALLLLLNNAACGTPECPDVEPTTSASTASSSSSGTVEPPPPLPQCDDDGMCERNEGSCADCRSCGNEQLDPGELCDDGNTDDSDDCVDNCQPASCGDRHVRLNPVEPADKEVCDEGEANVSSAAYEFVPRCLADPADPQQACKTFAPHCGDDICTKPDELINKCGLDCASECGNGYLEPGEACDSAMDTVDCNGKGAKNGEVECRRPGCGDGWHNSAAEACDDSNFDNTDDCVGACQLAACGDGFVQIGVEQCDDPSQPDRCENCVAIRRVFVTKQTYSGAQIGGLSGADGKCNGDAEAAGLPGRFRAWLSDGTGSPSSRFDTSFQGPYRLSNGMSIATGWSGLTSGSLLIPINLDVDGVTHEGSVWTNTTPDGMPDPMMLHCSSWSSNAGTSTIGASYATDAAWTSEGSGEGCGGGARLYCFEDR